MQLLIGYGKSNSRTNLKRPQRWQANELGEADRLMYGQYEVIISAMDDDYKGVYHAIRSQIHLLFGCISVDRIMSGKSKSD